MSSGTPQSQNRIDASCSCGKRYQVPIKYAGQKLKCKLCGGTFFVSLVEHPKNSTVEPLEAIDSVNRPISTGEASQSVYHSNVLPPRRFWKDPIVLIGGATPICIILCFIIYLYIQNSKDNFRKEIYRFKEQGDAHLATGQILRAYERYDSLLKWAGDSEPNDPQLKHALEIVRRTRDKLRPEVLAISEKRAKEAREKTEADERVRREQTELEEMAKLRVALKGDVWLTRQIGTSEIIRGLQIYLIKQKLPKMDLADALRTLRILPTGLLAVAKSMPDSSDETLARAKDLDLYSNIASVIDELSAKPESELIDVRQLYALSRIPFAGREGKLRTTGDAFKNLALLDVWLTTLSKIPHKVEHSRADGKYRFDDIQGGRYYAYATYRSAFNFVEWMIPVELNSSEKVVDFFNENAVLIINKNDD